MTTKEAKGLESLISGDCRRYLMPALQSLLENFEPHNDADNTPLIADFERRCSVCIEAWSADRDTEEKKFIEGVFSKEVKNMTGEIFTARPDLADKYRRYMPAGKNQGRQDNADGVKKGGGISQPLGAIFSAGWNLLGSMFSFKPPKLVEDAALVAEFALDVLFGGIKGLLREINPLTTKASVGIAQSIKLEDHKWTRENALAAVSKDGSLLRHIPESVLNGEICLAAVSNKGGALEYVPMQYKNAQLCDKAAAQNVKQAFLHVPDDLKTPAMCNAAVSADGANLQYVPKDKISRELCRAAVSAFGKSLEYVPRLLCDASMCAFAVSADGANLKFVPDNLKTRQLCADAQRNSSADLTEYMPIKYAPAKASPTPALLSAQSRAVIAEPHTQNNYKQTLKTA